MTVGCLTYLQKQVIVTLYNNRSYSQAELARQYHVSERTIHRVLEEAGIATPLERIKGDAYTVMQLLKEHGVDIPKLKQMLAVNKLLNTPCTKTKNDIDILNAI